MTHGDLVLDASALLRGVLRESDVASAAIERVAQGAVRAHVPDLADAEATNALLRLVRAGILEVREAERVVDLLVSLAIERHSSVTLARAALAVAIGTGLSAYDGLYAALALALDVPLLTADRGLAAAVPGARLV